MHAGILKTKTTLRVFRGVRSPLRFSSVSCGVRSLLEPLPMTQWPTERVANKPLGAVCKPISITNRTIGAMLQEYLRKAGAGEQVKCCKCGCQVPVQQGQHHDLRTENLRCLFPKYFRLKKSSWDVP